MRSPKSEILVFAARFALFFALVMIPWPGLGRVFNATFSVIASMAVDACIDDPDVLARFHPADPEKPDEASLGVWDTVFSVTRARDDAPLKVPLPLRRLAYVPLATFVALALATPVIRPRKLRILRWGLALLLFRLALTVALPIARNLEAFGRDSVLDWLARVVYYGLLEPPNLMYGAPVVVWFLLLFATSPGQFDRTLRFGLSAGGAPGAEERRPAA
ncbi:MAG TPA: hypothetical protein VK762_27730 [Polyangiaceae bacterium]|jgi:hypothetical protein|nr:hypothetical protein [Polyangiaceae bacterium]